MFSIVVYASEVPVFDINCVVLTKNPKAQQIATLNRCHEEVEILNTYFVTQDRKSFVKFRFKSYFRYDDIKEAPCTFLRYGDTKQYHQQQVKELYWQCQDPRIRSPRAINFYIVDSYSRQQGYHNIDSHGKNSGHHPFILIDWERLGHQIQSPETHEMGHAFGLPHICYENATINSDTNIMASSANCQGSGGKRNIGFNKKQVAIIQKHIKLVQKRFGL